MIRELIQEPIVQFVLVLCTLVILTYWNWAGAKRKREKIEFGRIKIAIGNDQILGKREKQDDSFATEETEYGIIAVVADGIGGLTNGKLASQLAVETVIEEFRRQENEIGNNPEYFFQTAAKRANQAITNTFGDVHGGTTLVIAVFIHSVLYYASVGDSSLLLVRRGKFIPLTKKQNLATWLEQQYQAGEITREEALLVPASRRLTEYVGHDGFLGIEVSIRPIPLQEGDRIFLYTDGVESLSQMELESFLNQSGEPDDIVHELMKRIRQKELPHQDNATAILLEIEKV